MSQVFDAFEDAGGWLLLLLLKVFDFHYSVGGPLRKFVGFHPAAVHVFAVEDDHNKGAALVQL